MHIVCQQLETVFKKGLHMLKNKLTISDKMTNPGGVRIWIREKQSIR